MLRLWSLASLATSDFRQGVELSLALSGLGREVPHQVLVGVAQEVVAVCAVGAEIEPLEDPEVEVGYSEGHGGGVVSSVGGWVTWGESPLGADRRSIKPVGPGRTEAPGPAQGASSTEGMRQWQT